MYSMNRTTRPVFRANVAKSTTSSSFIPARTTTLTLIGCSPTRSAASMADRTAARLPGTPDLGESGGPERITAEVDPPESGVGEPLCTTVEPDPVGRHRQVVEPDVGQHGDERLEPSAHQRFAAGDPHPRHPEPMRHPGDAGKLLVGEDLAAGEKRHSFLGHAVHAAQVATIGDRDPQVAVDPPEPVDQAITEGFGTRAAGTERQP